MSSRPGRAAAISAAALVAVGSVAGCSERSTRTIDAPWTVARSSSASSTVDVRYYHGDCDTLEGAHVVATRTTVRITVQVTESTGPCDTALRVSYARVRAGATLGNRAVVGSCRATDGICSPDVPVQIPRHVPVLGP